jgi:hypothetical protein
MKISGFTFLRNAHKLYYPIRESIISILEIVDEFVIALGEGDHDDTSLAIINSIESTKIKVIHTKWDLEKYPNGTEYAHQTDIAKQHCTGDWLFYLQGDEVVHEADLIEIKNACSKYLLDSKVEGFVFNYLHFFGDYQHYYSNHCWYKKEIRIIRNLPDIHSWRDAQSFRYIPDFQGNDYFRIANTRKLNCIALTARIFHYGWVRPPKLMKSKNDQANKIMNTSAGNTMAEKFDYGRLDFCKIFDTSHPAIMLEKIIELNWQEDLRTNGPITLNRGRMKHEKLKYRIISWVEENLLGGFVIGGFKNYKILERFK